MPLPIRIDSETFDESRLLVQQTTIRPIESVQVDGRGTRRPGKMRCCWPVHPLPDVCIFNDIVLNVITRTASC